jgi:choline dehydrogenase-like flavoprotein
MGSGSSNQGWVRAIGPQFRAGELIGRAGLVGTALRQALKAQTLREVAIGGSAEILPNPDNRVTLDAQKDALGLPRPNIRFDIDDYTKRSLVLGQQRHRQVMEALRCTSILDGPPRVNTSIIGGTARMGTDPKSSVVDGTLRSHDHPNLYVVGSSSFPTMGIAPPTLTIAALALRAAAQVQADLRS